jgi:hypothetical protein
MQLEDTRESYQFYSGKTSEIVRQLAFAGIAIIWVFKTNLGPKQIVPRELFPAGILLVVGLTLDLLHYVTGTLIWGIYNRGKEFLYLKPAGTDKDIGEKLANDISSPAQAYAPPSVSTNSVARYAAQQVLRRALNDEFRDITGEPLPAHLTLEPIIESEEAEEAEFSASPLVNYPTIFFFWSKVIVVLVAYGLLIQFLWKNLVS